VFSAFYRATEAAGAAKKRAAILAEPLDARARQAKLLSFETELGAQVLKAL
jgi:Zn-dependent oligopeptidase